MKKNCYFLIIILVFGFIIRLLSVFKQELWIDEAYSLYAIKFYNFPYDIVHPPFYYLILKIWTAVFFNFRWARILSVLFSISSLYIYFKLTKLILNKNFALLSLFLLTISPFHVHYGWQIRMYSLYILLTISSLYFFFIIFKQIKNKNSINPKAVLLFFIINLLGSLTNYGYGIYLFCLFIFLVFYMSKNNLFFILKKQKSSIAFLSAHLTIPLFYFLLLNNKSGDVLALTHWIKPINLERIFFIFLSLNGLYKDVFGLVPIKPGLCCLLVIILFSLIFYGFWQFKKKYPHIFILSLIMVFLPFFIILFFQQISSISVALPRTLSFILIFNQLALACSLYFLIKKDRSSLFRSGLLAFFSFVFFINLKTHTIINLKSFYIEEEYKNTVLFVKENLKKDDELLILPTYFQHLFWYHWGDFNSQNENLYKITKLVESNIATENYQFEDLKAVKNSLFVIVNSHSFLSKNELKLIEKLSQSCRVQSTGKETKIIVCPQDSLKII